MKHSLHTLLIAAAVLVLASCQKDFTPENTPIIPPPVTVDSGTLISQYVEIDSLASGQTDTSTIVKMEYDAQHRLVSLFSFNSATDAVTLAFYEKFFYQYNGSDTLPSRLIYELKEQDATSNLNTAKDTSYYTYNSAGKVILDSAIRNHSSSLGASRYFTKSEYNYSNGFFTIVKTDNDGGTINKSLDSVFATSTNNNLSSIRSANYTLPDSLFDYDYNSTFSYDNHPNPFHNIPALYATMPLYEFESTAVALFQKNNPLSISQTSSYSSPSTENLVYRYKANGYPEVFYSSYTSYDGSGNVETRYYKGVFTYN